MSCKMYTPYEGPDGMLLERNGKLTMWKSKSLRLSQWAIPENIHTHPPYGRHRIGYPGFLRRATAVFAGFQSLLIQNLEEFQNFGKI